MELHNIKINVIFCVIISDSMFELNKPIHIKGCQKKRSSQRFYSPRALELRYQPENLTKGALTKGKYMEEFSL